MSGCSKTRCSLFEQLLKVNMEPWEATMKETAEVLRARILDGAITLFSEKGIERVTTRELTEQLGISRSHIYHYFRDWETLCKEAMTLFMQRDRVEFADEIGALEARSQLSAFVQNYLPAAPDASWSLYSSLWQLAIRDEEWAQLAEAMMAQWQALLADIIDRGITAGHFRHRDAQRVTRQLWAMLNGYADQLIISPSPAAQQAATADINAFITVILVAPPEPVGKGA